MEVIIRPTAGHVFELGAELVAHAIRHKPNFVLGLATGRTMVGVYELLVEKYRQGALDFANVTTFNLDEYIGLPPEDPQSYHYFMQHHLFQHVNIDPANILIPDGMAEDIDAECARYEDETCHRGGIDLQLLGIGVSGHIGFNEPLSAMRSRTRPKALSPQTIAQNAHHFDDPDRMPRRAITMGVGTILDSRRCVLLATGEEKAEIIARAVEGPVTAMVSASALQLHPRCTVIVDEACAVQLQNTEYYRWIFESEPEWERYRENET